MDFLASLEGLSDELEFHERANLNLSMLCDFTPRFMLLLLSSHSGFNTQRSNDLYSTVADRGHTCDGKEN